MNAPANPHAAAFAAEWKAAMREAGVISAEPQPPRLPAHALALYPWLAKYQHTVRVEMLIIFNPRTKRYERGPVVTVTV